MALFGNRYWNKEGYTEEESPGDPVRNAYQREALIPVWNMAKEFLESQEDYDIARKPRLWRLKKAVLLVEYKENFVDKIMEEKFSHEGLW